MSQKTYHGSCACKRVTFEAEFDLAAGTGRCNCTTCLKRRNWTARVLPQNFRYGAGVSELSHASSAGRPDGFCKHCGVQLFYWVPKADWNDGEYVAVCVASLDDATPEEMMSGPVRYMNGRDDDWWHPPTYTRHL